MSREKRVGQLRLSRALCRAGTAVAFVGMLSTSLTLSGCATAPTSANAGGAEDDAREPVFVTSENQMDQLAMPADALAARMKEAVAITAEQKRIEVEQRKLRAEAEEKARQQAELERLAQQQAQPMVADAVAPEDVVWLDSRTDGAAVLKEVMQGEPATESQVGEVATQAGAASTSALAMPTGPVAVTAATQASTDNSQTVITVDRRAVVADLIDQIASSDDTAASKAVQLQALRIIEPSLGADDPAMDALDDGPREQIARFADLMLRWAGELKADKTPVAAVWLQKAVDEMLAGEPIHIRNTELCKRVDGYGVYTPFDSHTFLAGRSNAVIVYVELDNFRAVEIGSGQHEVKLSQAIEVYNEADGLRVWGSSPVQVLDRSRNRRRDFFVVQLIELPARLSVGKYLMKVRITDQHGGSVAETSIPLEYVADTSMVQRTNR